MVFAIVPFIIRDESDVVKHIRVLFVNFCIFYDFFMQKTRLLVQLHNNALFVL